MAARLLTELSKVDSLRSSQSLSTDKADELQDWLTKKLKSVHESLADVAETRIERIIEDTAATLDDDEDADTVISALQQQVTDAADEAEKVRQELARVQEELSEAEVKVAGLEAERDEAKERVVQLEGELQVSKDSLSLAEATIADLTAADVDETDEDDEVTEAVDAAIARNPDLAVHREHLLECVTPDEVVAEVATLCPPAPPKEPESQSVQRRALPPRGVVVESDARAGSTKPRTVGSQGARMAGAALGKMKVPTG
jgi:chromosome segregation ATPase